MAEWRPGQSRPQQTTRRAQVRQAPGPRAPPLGVVVRSEQEPVSLRAGPGWPEIRTAVVGPLAAGALVAQAGAASRSSAVSPARASRDADGVDGPGGPSGSGGPGSPGSPFG